MRDVHDPRDPGPPERPEPRGESPNEALLSWYRDVRQLARPELRERRRWTRRHTLDALACLALSTLCFSRARAEILFRADWGFYNRTPLGPPTLQALLLNIVVPAAAGFLAVQAVRRTQRPAWRRLAAVGAAAALLMALNFVRLAHEPLARWTDAAGVPGLLAVAVLVPAAAAVRPRPALRAVRGLLLVASPLAVLTLAHVPWMFLEVTVSPRWRPAEPAALERTPPSLRRVVWLVLDELDQRLTFEERPGGLEVPELDRLRRESLYADAARPPAGATEISMPALITGRPVVAVTPTSADDLELTFATGPAARWSTLPNVFSRARALGYETALIGWRLPYPRVLGGALGLADWRPSVDDEQARGDTLGEALRNQWGGLVPAAHARRLHAQRLAELGDPALHAATDGRFGLVLLHLPLPRSPGGYPDDLMFVDSLVGELRRSLDRTRVADRTWVVVSAARGWGSDRRVPFLVRPPDGGRPVHVDATFNTLAAHDLVLATLRGSITDTAAAAAWLTSQKIAVPKNYGSDGRPMY